MPGDSLTFAVFVRRQQKLPGALEFATQFGHDPLLVTRDYVNGPEPLVNVNRQRRPTLALEILGNLGSAGRQIADVTDRRRHGVAVAQVPLNGAGLGGRFDDYERVGVRFLPRGAASGGHGSVGGWLRPAKADWWRRLA